MTRFPRSPPHLKIVNSAHIEFEDSVRSVFLPFALTPMDNPGVHPKKESVFIDQSGLTRVEMVGMTLATAVIKPLALAVSWTNCPEEPKVPTLELTVAKVKAPEA